MKPGCSGSTTSTAAAAPNASASQPAASRTRIGSGYYGFTAEATEAARSDCLPWLRRGRAEDGVDHAHVGDGGAHVVAHRPQGAISRRENSTRTGRGGSGSPKGESRWT